MKSMKTIGKALLFATALSSSSAWAATLINGSSTNTISATFYEVAAVTVTGTAFPLFAGNTAAVTPIAQFTVSGNSNTGSVAIKLTSGAANPTGTTQVIPGLGSISLSSADNSNTSADNVTGYIYSNNTNQPYTFVATVPAGSQLVAGNYSIDVTAGIWN
ncbi:TPA: hypothetical protein QCG78_004620 [Enterobacter asburiae]|uniref:hypothetical protein n=1 Tax=Enterobacter asburiae TaxID=61645 RepID=UPI0010BB69F4|nr:hypothetical protein [Enterobacter asburiae]BEK81567.1 hypothetical protein EATA8330_44620 [Enterobacter asburiae]HEC5301803.1 hypothetical protein [Enterobacter asburiae]HEC5302009.1 hypothetical protein [Enterobacter asburiae]